MIDDKKHETIDTTERNAKPKLTNVEMIKHLKDKGVAFDSITEQEALALLRQNTYFYKITSYRKNFRKENGLYQNLDFAMLADLAIIDLYSRSIL